MLSVLTDSGSQRVQAKNKRKLLQKQTSGNEHGRQAKNAAVAIMNDCLALLHRLITREPWHRLYKTPT